jgi:hypothetical protein
VKKLNEYKLTELDALVLYEEDLRELFALLKEHSSDVKARVDNLEFDNIEELISKFAPKRIKQLNIQTASPSIIIMLNKVLARIETVITTPADLGLHHQCITIIKRSKRFCGILWSYRVLIPTLFIFSVFTNFLPKEERLPLQIVFYICFTWAFYIHMTRYSLMFCRQADSLETFFLRNKDRLFLDAIKTVVGFLIGLVLQRYFHLLR